MFRSVLREKKCVLTSLGRLFSQSSPSYLDFTDLQISPASNGLPRNIDVVICGGGVVGASVAYHLAQMGWGPRTILLEQAR